MKKIYLLLLLPIFAFSQSNSIYKSFGNVGFVTFAITNSIDTAIVVPSGGSKKFDFISIIAVSSADDTVAVDVVAMSDTTTYSQNSLTDLSSYSSVATAILTTASKEFLVNNPQARMIRLRLLGEDGSTVTVIVQGKFGER